MGSGEVVNRLVLYESCSIKALAHSCDYWIIGSFIIYVVSSANNCIRLQIASMCNSR